MINFAPSIFYAFVMLLPTSISLIVINNDINANYFYLVLCVTMSLFFTDFISNRVSGNSEMKLVRFLDSRVLFVVSLWFIFISLFINIYTHGGLPLLDYFESSDYAKTRAYHAKSSNLFIYASYAINYCNYIFIPYVLYYVLNKKNHVALVALVPVVLLSYTFFLSKNPMTFFLVVVIGVYVSAKYKFALYRYILIVMFVVSAISLINVLITSKSTTDKSNYYAVADLYRTNDQDGYYGVLNSKIYRTIWVSSEVSALWLEYSGSYDEAGSGFSVNYPNIIGKHYYVDRYPDKYTNDISAYASFEVDALVRYGYAGMFLSLFAWCCIRLTMAYWVRRYGNSLVNSYFLIGSAMMLPQSSIQALMLSNGFVFIALAPLLITWVNSYIGKNIQ